MKSILISIKPEWVCKILNGIKSIEIRKTAPKAWADYFSSKSFEKPTPIDVYIYCTKAKNKRKFTHIIPPRVERELGKAAEILKSNRVSEPFRFVIGRHCFSDGKVVAKFRLKSVAQYINGKNVRKNLKTDYIADGVLEGADMSIAELQKYGNGEHGESFFAWHISDLEIFDEPKPLTDFKGGKIFGDKPPQSWKYVEVEE